MHSCIQIYKENVSMKVNLLGNGVSVRIIMTTNVTIKLQSDFISHSIADFRSEQTFFRSAFVLVVTNPNFS